MYLSHLKIKNHPWLKDIDIDFINPKTGKPFSTIAFVGENGCGKTSLLNEIFDYNNSKYIIDKESENSFSTKPYASLFLRQSSLARNAMKEIGKLIDGKERYSASSTGSFNDGVKINNPLDNKQMGLELLKILDDPEIYKLFKDGSIKEVTCGSEISKLINGKESECDISTFSSGQQEILLKLKDLYEFCSSTDSVLLDEPETSLHPRWQLEIVNLIRLLLTDENNNVPQIFLATHSEKVLQSLLQNKDALIVRLYKDKGRIESETSSQMQLLLRKTTFAELDYVIFKIDSYEYCNELYDLIEWITGVNGDRGIDRKIRNSEFYDDKIHHKEWVNDKNGLITGYSLPVYVRNYFHHPKDRIEPTKEELHEAIVLLRNVVLNLSKQ